MTNQFPSSWQIQNSNIPADAIELRSILLANRHIDNVKSFFQPENPTNISLQQVGIDVVSCKAAVDRLIKAKQKNEQVIVFGDYDADGICASAIVWQTLHRLGWQISPFIPDRKKHGYGLSQASLDDLLNEKKPNLIVTVDNGIVADREIQWLIGQGIDVVLTDHHSPKLDKSGEVIWPATPYLVHSTQLCGTTVAWMLMKEIVIALEESNQLLDEQLDLCAIATIADQVPLLNENRQFAWHGLNKLRMSKRVGLQAMMAESGHKQAELNSDAVGYALSPRINAMGRMSHSLDAMRLLCTSSRTRAVELAKRLGQVNQERKDVTAQLLQIAQEQAQEQLDQKLLFIVNENFHEGVIGLVAGRLMEIYFRPVVVVGVADGIAKASARSVEGINITQMLRHVEDLLLSVGGHPLAAGFSAQVDQLPQIQTNLQELANNIIDEELLMKQTMVDCILPTQLLDFESAQVIEQMEPFGKSQPKPQFVVQNLVIKESVAIGQLSKHLKLMLTGEGLKQPVKALWWGKGEKAPDFQVGSEITCLCQLVVNRWNGRSSVELRLHRVA